MMKSVPAIITQNSVVHMMQKPQNHSNMPSSQLIQENDLIKNNNSYNLINQQNWEIKSQISQLNNTNTSITRQLEKCKLNQAQQEQLQKKIQEDKQNQEQQTYRLNNNVSTNDLAVSTSFQPQQHGQDIAFDQIQQFLENQEQKEQSAYQKLQTALSQQSHVTEKPIEILTELKTLIDIKTVDLNDTDDQSPTVIAKLQIESLPVKKPLQIITEDSVMYENEEFRGSSEFMAMIDDQQPAYPIPLVKMPEFRISELQKGPIRKNSSLFKSEVNEDSNKVSKKISTVSTNNSNEDLNTSQKPKLLLGEELQFDDFQIHKNVSEPISEIIQYIASPRQDLTSQ